MLTDVKCTAGQRCCFLSSKIVLFSNKTENKIILLENGDYGATWINENLNKKFTDNCELNNKIIFMFKITLNPLKWIE